MEYLERKITVFEPSYVKPIYVVQNSNMFEIRISITDWDIPSGAEVKWQVATETKGELNFADVNVNTIYIRPYATTFSEAGKGYLQVRIDYDGRTLVSFAIDIYIQDDKVTNPVEGSTSDVIKVLVEQYVEEATEGVIAQVEAEGQRVIDTIPSDYTALSNKVNAVDLVSQEMIEPSYLNANGTEASGFSNGEIKTTFIEVEPNTEYAFFSWVNISNNQYWHRHCWYDENKNFISQVSKTESNVNTDYTSRVKYTSPSDAKYIRLSMRSYYDGVFSLYKGNIALESVERPVRYTADVVPHITDRFNVKSIAHAGYTPDDGGAPENTLIAYVEAKRHGFDLVECDLTFTSDGVCVLLHDKTINRTGRNADGSEISSTINIRDITYEQALEYDFGIWKGEEYEGAKLPTLDEFLSLCRDLHLYPYIELKSGDGWTRSEVESVIDIIEENGMSEKATLISLSYENLGWAKTYCPTMRLGYITNLGTNWTNALRYGEIFKSGMNQVFIDCRKEVVNPEHSEYVTGYQEAPNKGIGLECWTVYTNPEIWFEKCDKLIQGFTTAQYRFDEYMKSKWGVES